MRALALLLWAGFPAAAAAATCPPAQATIEVEVVHGELGEASDVTLAELAQVARKQPQQLRHPLLGAYTRSIAIGLNIEDVVDQVAGGVCTVPMAVRVRLTLMHRVVHLPRDFTSNPCLLDLARSHEQKHGDADDALLDRLVAKYPEDLRIRLTALILEPAPSETEARLQMTVAARRMVQQQLDSYEHDQADQVGAAVDTSEEVARLSAACGGALKSGHPL